MSNTPQEPNALVKYALSEIVQTINRGSTPQAALEKVSKDLDLNHNFIKRAAEATNVALHYNHFKRHPESRDSDFPIADSGKAIKNIFGNKEKTASEYTSEKFPDRSNDAHTVNFEKINGPGYKQAYLKMLAQGKEASESYFPMSAAGVYEKSAQYINKLEKQLDDLRTEKVGSQQKCDSAFVTLVHEFSKDASYRDAFHEFESQVYSNHGEKAVPFIDYIYKCSETKDERGAHDSGYRMFEDCKTARMFDKFMKSSEELVKTEKIEKEASDLLEFEQGFVKDIFKSLGKHSADSEVIKESAEKKEGPFGVLSGIYNQLSSAPKNTAGSEPITDTHARQLMLTELMASDPVIHKAFKDNPNGIASHYEQLMRLAPELSKEKEFVRTHLAAAPSRQGMSEFDVNQIISANNELNKTKVLQKTLSGELNGKPA